MQQNYNKTSYIVKLFKGEISLFITFWIYGIFIGFSLGYLLEFISKMYHTEITSNILLLFAFIFINFLVIVYNMFMWIAMWRSANKYKGKKSISELVKLYVVFSIFVTFSAIYNMFVK